MKDNGKKTKNQEMELTFGRMEINMSENLEMTWEMALENITIQMATIMKDNGKNINNQDMELTFGKMDINMLEKVGQHIMKLVELRCYTEFR